MLELRPITVVKVINYGVPNKFEAFKVDFMQHSMNFELGSSQNDL